MLTRHFSTPKLGDRVRYWRRGSHPTTIDGAIGTITELVIDRDGSPCAFIQPDYGQEQQHEQGSYLVQGAMEGYELLRDRSTDPQTKLERRLAIDRALAQMLGWQHVHSSIMTPDPTPQVILLYRGPKSQVVRSNPFLMVDDPPLYDHSFIPWSPTTVEADAWQVIDSLQWQYEVAHRGTVVHIQLSRPLPTRPLPNGRITYHAQQATRIETFCAIFDQVVEDMHVDV